MLVLYRYRYRKVCSTYDSVYMREEFCTDTDIRKACSAYDSVCVMEKFCKDINKGWGENNRIEYV